MTTFANASKNAASLTNESKASRAFSELLMQTGDTILLQTGDKLLIQGAASDTSWANASKN